MKKILIVDDEKQVRSLFVKQLSRLSYECLEARNGLEGLQLIAAHPDCQIVLTDLSMPKMDGLAMISKSREFIDRYIAFIVLTGNGNKDGAVQALRLGVADFLDKPLSSKTLIEAVLRADEDVTRRLLDVRASSVSNQVREQLDEANLQLQQSNQSVARQIADVAKYRDNETAEHCERVGRYSRLIAELMEMPPEFCDRIELAAILHDVGKIGIPDAILSKEGPLTESEFSLMKQHTVFGANMLSEHRNNPILEMARTIALCHHERWDGSGYPEQLVGAQIPIPARICAIVDVYDALRTARSYKPAFTHEVALRVILEGDGRTHPQHFDPVTLSIFSANHQQFEEIYNSNPDKSRPAF